MGMVFVLEIYCFVDDGFLVVCIEEEVVVIDDGL